jgi:hypothetical protein
MNAPKGRDPLADAVAVMGALPVPVGPDKPAGLSPELRATIAEQLGEAKPARDGVLVSLAQSVKDRAEHDHSTAADWDWYCLNLSGYMGDRMGPVLRRLLDAESERDALRARVAELEAAAEGQRQQGYEAAIEVMRQEKLPMSVGLLEAQLELDALDALAARDTHSVDEDPIAYSLTDAACSCGPQMRCPKGHCSRHYMCQDCGNCCSCSCRCAGGEFVEALHASSGAVIETPSRRAAAEQRNGGAA